MTKLDELFPNVALPSTASDSFSVAGVLQIMCQWNAALVRDLSSLRVEFVDSLQWADEEFDGSSWVEAPTPGEGETDGHAIYVATDGGNFTNEKVAMILYHEYQHARSPYAYRTRSWEEEERRAYELETYWAIARGMATDPGHTTSDPVTGETTVDPGGIEATVEDYPGIGPDPTRGEVFQKVRGNRVRVRMPDGTVQVRPAVAGDTVPGAREITGARRRLGRSECRC